MSANEENTSWHEVETQIRKEVLWLLSALDSFLISEKHVPFTCKYCFFRSVATLIIQGDVRAAEIRKSPFLNDFWSQAPSKNSKKIYHGSDWHKETMEKIENHFLARDFEVKREPALQQGRADLGIHKENHPDLFVEVGTVSIFKLAVNLMTMGNFVYLMVPNDEVLDRKSVV